MNGIGRGQGQGGRGNGKSNSSSSNSSKSGNSQSLQTANNSRGSGVPLALLGGSFGILRTGNTPNPSSGLGVGVSGSSSVNSANRTIIIIFKSVNRTIIEQNTKRSSDILDIEFGHTILASRGTTERELRGVTEKSKSLY